MALARTDVSEKVLSPEDGESTLSETSVQSSATPFKAHEDIFN
jgi:hypothetical protein